MSPFRLPKAEILGILILSGSAFASATFEPVYLDDPNEGFNDPSAPDQQSADGGNPGGTLGEQRQWAFEMALEFWEVRLDSNVTIFVEAEMNDLSCDSSSAVLGFAGTNSVHRDWAPANGGTSGRANTWYSQALANKLSNKDLCTPDPPACEDPEGNPIDNDIGSTFNKRIDESDSCLGSNVWYYALDEAPFGTVSFYKTALHEIGHGINFQTFVTLSDGTKLSGLDDIYMVFLEDHSTEKTWPNMSNQERAASATDTNDLHWIGDAVLDSIGALSSGRSEGHVEMYAPSPLEGGSSVSHWDKDVDDTGGNSELMEPSATGVEKIYLTDELLEDLGWNEFSACGPTLADEEIISSAIATSTVTYQACRVLTLGENFIAQDGAEVTAEAPYGVALNGDLAIEQGATLRITFDPSIGEL